MPTKVKKTTKKIIKKVPVKKAVSVKKAPEAKKVKKQEKYFECLGRRKTAKARVRLFDQKEGERTFLVNGKPLESYFPTLEIKEIIISPFKLMECLEQFSVSAMVKGGGFSSQAEAVRHGIAKALVLFNPDFRKKLKKAGYLTRDPRMRERKKFGLKRARRAPQWQKR